MEENSTSKQKEHSKLIRHFDKLENSYYEKSVENDKDVQNLPLLTEYTGLQTGKVFNSKVNDDNIKLFVRTKSEIYEFKLDTHEEYSEDLEFVRFLSYYNININRPSELIGKEVKIRKNSNGWELYIPEKVTKYNKIKYQLDKYARLFGYHNLNLYKSPYEFIMGSFVLFSVSVTFSTITYYLLQLIISNYISMSVYILLILLFPFVSSMLYRLNKVIKN